MLVGDALLDDGKLAFYLQQQSGECIRLAFHWCEEIVRQLKYARKVGQQGLRFKDVRVLVEPCVWLLLVIVIFVVDLADNLLDAVLHRDDAAGADKLIHYDGDMHLVGLEVAQQFVYHLCLGYEIRWSYQALPAER